MIKIFNLFIQSVDINNDLSIKTQSSKGRDFLGFPTFLRANRGKSMTCEAKSLESRFFRLNDRRRDLAEAKVSPLKTEILSRNGLFFRTYCRRQSAFRQDFDCLPKAGRSRNGAARA
jgi:hypothetical protein